MRDIAELNVLLRAHAETPQGLTLAADGFREGWDRLRTRSANGLERKIKACRWHFIRAAKRMMASGMGQTPQQAIACALDHALAGVSPELNAIEVRDIQSTQYPWFWLARVSIHAFQIRQREDLDSPDQTVLLHHTDIQPRLQAHPAGFDRGFASAMPLMEPISPSSPHLHSVVQG